jgi:RNA polymerase sigma-70 factor (sigma-E family)
MDAAVEDDFHEFVVARSPALLVTAYLLTGDRGTAEDLLQITLMKAHRHWARIRAAGEPEAYLRRIMANQRISWWRRRRVAIADLPLPDVPVPDDFGRLELRDELWRALRTLPPRTRAVLVLRYWEDRSEAETARILDCSVGSVKSQASRGLQRLRVVLAGDTTPVDGAAAPSSREATR